MKAMNGKCGIFAALTAALLVTVALITSCPEPTDGGAIPEGYQPPAGMGYIIVKVPEFSGERTVLPSAGTWTTFALSIQQYSASTGTATIGGPITKPPITNTPAALATPINLAPGYYELTVTASVTGGAAAEGTSTRFTISPGTGTPVTVIIKPLPFATATGSGTFEYTINLNGITATTLMTITPLVEGASPGTVTVTSDNSPHTMTLTPGSYNVSLEATISVTNKASITEVVNIHQNLKSSVTFIFNGSYFVAYIDGITIEYKTDDVKPELENISAVAVTEATTISLSLAATASETIEIINASDFNSLIWSSGGITTTLPGGDTSFTIEAGTAPFINPGTTYPVTVIGVINGKGAYSTSFKVSIGN